MLAVIFKVLAFLCVWQDRQKSCVWLETDLSSHTLIPLGVSRFMHMLFFIWTAIIRSVFPSNLRLSAPWNWLEQSVLMWMSVTVCVCLYSTWQSVWREAQTWTWMLSSGARLGCLRGGRLHTGPRGVKGQLHTTLRPWEGNGNMIFTKCRAERGSWGFHMLISSTSAEPPSSISGKLRWMSAESINQLVVT